MHQRQKRLKMEVPVFFRVAGAVPGADRVTITSTLARNSAKSTHARDATSVYLG
uniref:hypothetical protein n=1 Tax=Pararhizobium sp. IMCC3301 TaxID=3067904 RepID=UPI00274201BE|nr:hypothetical protein [Pararhizobium sp. IMCC3301]